MGDIQKEGIPNGGFLVIAFTDETMADKALAEMKEAKGNEEFHFEEAAVVRQGADGKATYYETGDMGAGKGAGIGALIGGVLGILGGPGGVVIGAGIGAGIGGVAAASDTGFRDESLETLGVALKPGTSALALITSDAFLKAIHEKVPVEEIRTAVANLSKEISDQLAANKSLAVRFLVDEEGLTFTEIAADDDSAQVVAAVLTDEGIAAGAAVITDEGAAYKVARATGVGVAVEAGVLTNEGAVVVDAAETLDAAADDTPTKTPSE